ncbi:MAG TPA: transcription antitermination factor NusB [Tepidisphaeraceae bacterium]|nr:transcription antitermination factor NusB [Tepidisphaeraceae bacterium]
MNARDLALMELDGRELPRWDKHVVRDAVGPSQIDERDRALGEKIYAVVVKNLLALQFLTEHYSKRQLDQIDPVAQKILAIGLAQLRFLSRIPASAAVDEAVKQTRRFGRKSAAGFVNAVLRNATREPGVALPQRVGLSHPGEMIDRLTELFGEDQAVAICEHDNAEPPTLVRLCRGMEAAALQADGVSVRPHQDRGIFVVEGARRATLGEWSSRGIAQVQDATAAGVVPRLDLRAGQRVLDRCCGLGTKTRQIRELVGETGRIVAVDPSGQRCAVLRELLRQQKIENVDVVQAEMISPMEPAAFDCALVDVPCSNSGVMARRVEARYMQTRERLESLVKLQKAILADTAAWVKVGGLLMYSTCSLWPEENQERAAAFLRGRDDYELVEEKLTLPAGKDEATAYRDGGYWALLRRR